MKKFTYIFIYLLLSVYFWNLSLFHTSWIKDIILGLTIIWTFCAYFIFQGKKRLSYIFAMKYIRYMYIIFIGVFISMFSAYFFWDQNILTSLIAQRYLYSFIILPTILYVQPTNYDIIKAIKWISFLTITIWVITIFYPQIIWFDEEQLALQQNTDSQELGILVPGIHFVVLYLYIKIQEYIKEFSWNSFFIAVLLMVFVLLFQNRSLIIGSLLVFAFSLTKINSKNKILVIFFTSVFGTTAILYSINMWISLINETQVQVTDFEYNRWKALLYFFNDYSPNWFCYIFGNGFPSTHSTFGDLMLQQWENGIFASDLGLIGMWTNFGLIPVIAIYTVIFKIISGKIFPLYLKFICFHILFVPTIFNFWGNPGIFLFVLIIYLYAYYTEHYKLSIRNVINNNSKLQKRRENYILYKRGTDKD